jgi:hypothetical protein
MRSAPRCGHSEKDHHERKDEPRKLTTITNVSVDGVMQRLGGSDEDRRGEFERRGWALPLFNNDKLAATFLDEVYQCADSGDSPIWTALNTQPKYVASSSPDIALGLVDSRAFPKGISLQVYRPAGRPQYATVTAA